MYPATLLKVFISFMSYLMRHLGLLMAIIISSANKETPFPIHIALITFSCLTALAKTSSTILNRYGEGGQPHLITDFRRIAFNFATCKLLLAMSLL